MPEIREKRKSENLIIRLSSEVKSLLEQNCSEVGLTKSEYVRLLILEDARNKN